MCKCSPSLSPAAPSSPYLFSGTQPNLQCQGRLLVEEWLRCSDGNPRVCAERLRRMANGRASWGWPEACFQARDVADALLTGAMKVCARISVHFVGEGVACREALGLFSLPFRMPASVVGGKTERNGSLEFLSLRRVQVCDKTRRVGVWTSATKSSVCVCE